MSADTLQMTSFFLAMLCFWGGAVSAVGLLLAPKRFRVAYANGPVIAGFVLLTAFFLLRWSAIGFLPVTGMFESLSFFIWAVTLVYLIVEYVFKLPSLSSFVLPAVAVFALIAASVAGDPVAVDAKLKSGWFYLHVLFAFMGYAAFAVATGSAIMYLLQRRQLKAKKSFDSIFNRLPSLEVLDEVNQKLINMGFPLFTIAIGAGIFWAHKSEILGPDWSGDPKMVFTGITWLLYAALFHMRLLADARGKRVAQLTIVAFAFVIMTFLGSGFLAVGSHEFLK